MKWDPHLKMCVGGWVVSGEWGTKLSAYRCHLRCNVEVRPLAYTEPGLTDSHLGLCESCSDSRESVQFANQCELRINSQARQSIAGRLAQYQEALRILVGFARIRSVCESLRIANRQPSYMGLGSPTPGRESMPHPASW